MTVNVRKVRKDDVKGIIELIKQISYVINGKRVYARESPSSLRRIIRDCNNINVVAHINSNIVGYGRVRIVNEKEGRIERIVVGEKYRRRGIGGLILGELERLTLEYMKRRDIEELMLVALVDVENEPAFRLFSSRHYSYSLVKCESYTAYRMKKILRYGIENT